MVKSYKEGVYSMGKKFISVTADFLEDGRVKPLRLNWEDGRRFYIDRIMDVRQAASLKAGGIGIRYTCMIAGKQIYLYKDQDQWFMEVND